MYQYVAFIHKLAGQNMIKLTPTVVVVFVVSGRWERSGRVVCEDWDGSFELLMSSQFQCWVLTPWPCCKGSTITNTLSAKISSLTRGYLSNSCLGSVMSMNFRLYVVCVVGNHCGNCVTLLCLLAFDLL